MKEKLLDIFCQAYRELRPRAPMPDLEVEFFPFANLNSTIRLREGKLLVRVSDLLEGAPDAVLRALAHILLAKVYRKPIERKYSTRYRQYVTRQDIRERVHILRQARGKKRIEGAQGRVYNLEALFDDLNVRFFHGLLGRPQMTWSRTHAMRNLGHYDPAHNAIVISRAFDDARVPRHAVEYIVYHEMLHLKHPVKVRRGRRCVHSAEFTAEEKRFPQYAAAQRFLKGLGATCD
jgi:hypothetical protein